MLDSVGDTEADGVTLVEPVEDLLERMLGLAAAERVAPAPAAPFSDALGGGELEKLGLELKDGDPLCDSDTLGDTVPLSEADGETELETVYVAELLVCADELRELKGEALDSPLGEGVDRKLCEWLGVIEPPPLTMPPSGPMPSGVCEGEMLGEEEEERDTRAEREPEAVAVRAWHTEASAVIEGRDDCEALKVLVSVDPMEAVGVVLSLPVAVLDFVSSAVGDSEALPVWLAAVVTEGVLDALDVALVVTVAVAVALPDPLAADEAVALLLALGAELVEAVPVSDAVPLPPTRDALVEAEAAEETDAEAVSLPGAGDAEGTALRDMEEDRSELRDGEFVRVALREIVPARDGDDVGELLTLPLPLKLLVWLALGLPLGDSVALPLMLTLGLMLGLAEPERESPALPEGGSVTVVDAAAERVAPPMGEFEDAADAETSKDGEGESVAVVSAFVAEMSDEGVAVTDADSVAVDVPNGESDADGEPLGALVPVLAGVGETEDVDEGVSVAVPEALSDAPPEVVADSEYVSVVVAFALSLVTPLLLGDRVPLDVGQAVPVDVEEGVPLLTELTLEEDDAVALVDALAVPVEVAVPVLLRLAAIDRVGVCEPRPESVGDGAVEYDSVARAVPVIEAETDGEEDALGEGASEAETDRLGVADTLGEGETEPLLLPGAPPSAPAEALAAGAVAVPPSAVAEKGVALGEKLDACVRDTVEVGEELALRVVLAERVEDSVALPGDAVAASVAVTVGVELCEAEGQEDTVDVPLGVPEPVAPSERVTLPEPVAVAEALGVPVPLVVAVEDTLAEAKAEALLVELLVKDPVAVLEAEAAEEKVDTAETLPPMDTVKLAVAVKAALPLRLPLGHDVDEGEGCALDEPSTEPLSVAVAQPVGVPLGDDDSEALLLREGSRDTVVPLVAEALGEGVELAHTLSLRFSEREGVDEGVAVLLELCDALGEPLVAMEELWLGLLV